MRHATAEMVGAGWAALRSGDWAQIRHAAQLAQTMLVGHIYLRGCTDVGRYVQLSGRPRIFNQGIIRIGDRVRIHSTVVPVELASMPGAVLEIGERSFLNYGVSISAHQHVRIGRRCLLGSYVNILDNDWHDILDRQRVPPSRPVTLEDEVWLGNRVIVLPGVTIGQGAVVGAGSVVTKDIPARSVAAGNPARVIRHF